MKLLLINHHQPLLMIKLYKKAYIYKQSNFKINSFPQFCKSKLANKKKMLKKSKNLKNEELEKNMNKLFLQISFTRYIKKLLS